MELSLHGSQINLATRQATKPNNLNANFCGSSRPGSAQVGYRSRNNILLSKENKRPASADTTGFCIANDLRKKRPSSSSNILKLLLAEPIKHQYWSSSCDRDNDVKSDVSLGEKIKLKAHEQMRDESISSDENSDEVEEEIQGDVVEKADSNDEDKEVGTTQEEIKFSAREMKLTTKPPLPLGKNLPKFGLPLNNLVKSENNLVSFNQYFRNTAPYKSNIKPDDDRWKLNSWLDGSVGSGNKISDLPGRVSFSKSDVMVLNCSDNENSDEEHGTNVNKKFVHFREVTSVVPSSDMSRNSDENNYSSSLVQSEHTKPPAMISQTDQIIEDYKREIEILNRQHEIQLHNAQVIKSNEDTAHESYNIEQEHDDGLEINLNTSESNPDLNLKEGVDVIKEFYESVESIPPPIPSSSEDYADLKWNNTNAPQKSFYNFPPLQNSAEEVIQNYLSVKDEHLPTTSTDNKNTSPKKLKSSTAKNSTTTAAAIATTSQKNIKSIRKSKSAALNNAASNATSSSTTSTHSTNAKSIKSGDKATLKKSKSLVCLKEKSNLNEFQIDKIESWMSMHEDSLSDRDDIHHHHHHHHHQHRHQVEWRETPTSKTDDEGNFSLDDHIDIHSGTESTYDEIVEIIKEIDSEKRKSDDFKDIKNSVEFKLKSLMSSDSDDSPTGSDNTESSNDKMKEILTYLDDIDEKCNKTLEDVKKFVPPSSARSELEFTIEADIIEDVPKICDLVMFPNHQLARRIVTLSLRCNELSNAILLSKEHVSHVRAEKQKVIRLEKQNSQNRLKEQKKHYEGIVQRHQGFIEQLLKDKSGLCDKITNMTRRFDSQNQAWEHKLTTEVARAKEQALAGEKIRREKWVRDNTKRIKELTVKGVETEINRMTSNYQQEISDLKQKHQFELQNVIEDARIKYDSKEKDIRDSYAKDREGAIERERQALHDRFEKQMKMEQMTFEQQRQRLIAEFSSERDRLYLDVKEKEENFDSTKENLLKERNDMIEQVKRDYNEKLKMQEIKHQSELSSLQDRFETDFAIWKREHESTYKRREVEREESIRQQCRMERDRQIDSIVARVDGEQIQNQQEFEMKMIRVKEKYEGEMKELEKSEKLAKERFNETRNKLGESEAQIQNHQATIKQLEMELNHFKKMCDDFMKEKENFKEVARKELKSEIKTVHKERDNEIQRIYARVQHAMEKKDSAVELLQKENAVLKERCFKLEAVIRQQRKDYCIK